MATKRIKIICAAVESLDGKTTNGGNPDIYKWSSKEDADHFFSLIQQNNCILMGSKTYEAAKHLMQHTPGKLRIVFTKNPETYKEEAIPNQLEFTANSPKEAIEQLTERGFINALLVGGATLNTAFLKENLIDELWLTVEPIVLGSGNPLFAKNTVRKQLELLTMGKLNEKGTMLLKYSL